jgi:hypothetical protein
MTITTATKEATPTIFVDDDSWAQPRDTAGRGWKLFAGVLAGLVSLLVVFGVGARYGKSNAPASTAGRGGFGAGGFGAAGFGPTGANGATGAPTAEQLAQIFGQGSGGATPGVRSSTTGANTGKGGEVVQGTIVSVTAGELTVARADGSMATIALTAQTPIGKRTTATRTDLVVGQRVDVYTTTDEAVAASEIMIGELISKDSVNSTAAPATPTTVDPGLGGLLPG